MFMWSYVYNLFKIQSHIFACYVIVSPTFCDAMPCLRGPVTGWLLQRPRFDHGLSLYFRDVGIKWIQNDGFWECRQESSGREEAAVTGSGNEPSDCMRDEIFWNSWEICIFSRTLLCVLVCKHCFLISRFCYVFCPFFGQQYPLMRLLVNLVCLSQPKLLRDL